MVVHRLWPVLVIAFVFLFNTGCYQCGHLFEGVRQFIHPHHDRGTKGSGGGKGWGGVRGGEGQREESEERRFTSFPETFWACLAFFWASQGALVVTAGFRSKSLPKRTLGRALGLISYPRTQKGPRLCVDLLAFFR